MAMNWKSDSPEDTEKAGREFALSLGDKNAVVALYGELGAGKSCFVRGAAVSLGVSDRVSSPTFSIINCYSGKKAVYHMDAYRLKSASEILRIGFEDYVADDSVCFIEWPGRIESLLPEGTIKVRFTIKGETAREISVE